MRMAFSRKGLDKQGHQPSTADAGQARRAKRRDFSGGIETPPLKVLLDNGVDRAAVLASPALGAGIINGVGIAGLGNGTKGAGIDAGAARDAVFSNFHGSVPPLMG
jgi:hypothetical protein